MNCGIWRRFMTVYHGCWWRLGGSEHSLKAKRTNTYRLPSLSTAFWFALPCQIASGSLHDRQTSTMNAAISTTMNSTQEMGVSTVSYQTVNTSSPHVLDSFATTDWFGLRQGNDSEPPFSHPWPNESGVDGLFPDTSQFPYPGTITFPPVWEVAIKIGFYVLIMGLALLGNVLVVYIVWKNKHMHTTTNYYIVNLAVSDLMVTLTCTWVHLVDDLTEGWILGAFFCKFDSFAQGKFYFY